MKREATPLATALLGIHDHESSGSLPHLLLSFNCCSSLKDASRLKLLRRLQLRLRSCAKIARQFSHVKRVLGLLQINLKPNHNKVMVSTKAQAGWRLGEGAVAGGFGQVACLGACLEHRYERIICNHSKNPNINLQLHMGGGVWSVAGSGRRGSWRRKCQAV